MKDLAPFSLTVLVLSILISCTKKEPNQNDLHIGLLGEPKSLDWTVAKDSSTKGFLDTFVPRLVRFNKLKDVTTDKDTLLKSIKANDNSFKKWTLTLNNKVWSDGLSLKPQHLVNAFKRVLDKSIDSPCSIRAQEMFEEQKSFTLVNDHSLTVSLKTSNPNFPKELTRLCYSPVRQDLINILKDQWHSPNQIVTLSPFEIKSYVYGSHVFLQRKKASIVYPNRIKFSFFSSSEPMVSLFEQKKLDFVSLVSDFTASKYKGTKSLISTPLLMTNFIVLNTRHPKFKNKEQRQSFIQAIDRSKLQKIAGSYRQKNSFFLPDFFINDFIKTSLKKRKIKIQLDLKIDRLRILTNNSSFQKQWIQILQYQLKKQDVDLEIDSKPWSSYLNDLNRLEHPLARMSWGSDTYQVNDFLDLWVSTSPTNRASFKNTEYDKLVQDIQKTSDKKKRDQMIVKALELILFKEAIVYPVYQESKLQLINPKLKNFTDLDIHFYDFSKVSR